VLRVVREIADALGTPTGAASCTVM